MNLRDEIKARMSKNTEVVDSLSLEEEDLLSIVYWQNGVNNEFTVSFRYVDNQFVLDGFNGHGIIK